MTLHMNDSHLVSIAQMKEFLKVDSVIRFRSLSQKETYQWLEEVLQRFRYFKLRKKKKSILKDYIRKMTSLSEAQATRLIARKKKFGAIWLGSTKRRRFPKKYTPEDIGRLIETDNLHRRLSGPATKKIFQRMYEIFKDQRFQRLKDISSSHIYNLRETRQYQSQALTVQKTNSVKILIAERRKPDSQGQPGFLRVDTVHQGDLDKDASRGLSPGKGVYHINLVDEATQWEIVGSVEKISEHFLAPLLEDLITQFPFVIKGFHSDNGSEFINRVVAELLNKLLIHQTKSRARHTNDNALVEGKNGSIIRKHIGYLFIPKGQAKSLNQFYQEHLNVYVNYHRPSGFATTVTDAKGKQKKIYNIYLTPYERFKSLPEAEKYLQPGITFGGLDKIAYEKSDNECAAVMQKAKQELFKKFNQKLQFPTIYATVMSGSISRSYVD